MDIYTEVAFIYMIYILDEVALMQMAAVTLHFSKSSSDKEVKTSK